MGRSGSRDVPAVLDRGKRPLHISRHDRSQQVNPAPTARRRFIAARFAGCISLIQKTARCADLLDPVEMVLGMNGQQPRSTALGFNSTSGGLSRLQIEIEHELRKRIGRATEPRVAHGLVNGANAVGRSGCIGPVSCSINRGLEQKPTMVIPPRSAETSSGASTAIIAAAANDIDCADTASKLPIPPR